jgi:tRNA pseudouridine55 synthase
MSFNFQKGELILIDKELEWTSFDVVNKLRSSIKRKLKIKKLKVGHAGTLDPLATGLIILCTGKLTKSINNYSGMEKTYCGRMIVGSTTPSFDLETSPNVFFPVDHIDEKLIEQTRKEFEGEIFQKPPVFSAIKKDGVRLYKLARKGIEASIKKRKINVEYFRIVSVDLPIISFEIKCSKGTYIRSIVNDFGKKLNSGAHLIELRRTSIGNFSLENAMKINNFIKRINP